MVLLMLAKSIFYSDYYPVDEAYNVIAEIREPERLAALDTGVFSD